MGARARLAGAGGNGGSGGRSNRKQAYPREALCHPCRKKLPPSELALAPEPLFGWPLRRSQHDRAEPGAGCKGQNQAGGHGGGLQLILLSGLQRQAFQAGSGPGLGMPDADNTQSLKLCEYKQTLPGDAYGAARRFLVTSRSGSVRRVATRGGKRSSGAVNGIARQFGRLGGRRRLNSG